MGKIFPRYICFLKKPADSVRQVFLFQLCIKLSCLAMIS